MFTWELPVAQAGFELVRPELEQRLFPIEVEIMRKLYEFCPEAYHENAHEKWSSNLHWPQYIKTLLSDLGSSHGYLVYPEREGDSFSGEWMFDLVWVDAMPQKSPLKMWHFARYEIH